MVEQLIIRAISALVLAAGLIEGCTSCVPAVLISDLNAQACQQALATEFPADSLEVCTIE